MFLCRDFGLASANRFFKDYQVIILDDLFKDRQNLDGMHGEIALESFGSFIQDIYDQRKLVLVSSNFSLAHIQSRLEVVDTGPGIPAGQAERLFEPFERAQHPERDPVAGAGLVRLAGLTTPFFPKGAP